MKYTWKCASCAICAYHLSQSANPYVVGFEIYSKHARLSPKCINQVLEILEGDAETLMQSPSFQKNIVVIRNVGGDVEIKNNVVTLYRGLMPQSTIEAFAGRLKLLDSSNLLQIIIGTRDRP